MRIMRPSPASIVPQNRGAGSNRRSRQVGGSSTELGEEGGIRGGTTAQFGPRSSAPERCLEGLVARLLGWAVVVATRQIAVRQTDLLPPAVLGSTRPQAGHREGLVRVEVGEDAV